MYSGRGYSTMPLRNSGPSITCWGWSCRKVLWAIDRGVRRRNGVGAVSSRSGFHFEEWVVSPPVASSLFPLDKVPTAKGILIKGLPHAAHEGPFSQGHPFTSENFFLEFAHRSMKPNFTVHPLTSCAHACLQRCILHRRLEPRRGKKYDSCLWRVLTP